MWIDPTWNIFISMFAVTAFFYSHMLHSIVMIGNHSPSFTNTVLFSVGLGSVLVIRSLTEMIYFSSTFILPSPQLQQTQTPTLKGRIGLYRCSRTSNDTSYSIVYVNGYIFQSLIFHSIGQYCVVSNHAPYNNP